MSYGVFKTSMHYVEGHAVQWSSYEREALRAVLADQWPSAILLIKCGSVRLSCNVLFDVFHSLHHRLHLVNFPIGALVMLL